MGTGGIRPFFDPPQGERQMRPEAEHRWDPPSRDAEGMVEIDLREQLRLLQKRVWWIVGAVGATLALAVLYLIVSPRIYQATASIIIEPEAPRVLGENTEIVDFVGSDYWSNKEFLETQYKVISSREVLRRVVEKKGLDRDLDFLGLAKVRDPERRLELLERIDPVEVLQDRMRVEPVKNSQLTRIVVEDTDPERAADLANTIVEAYVESNLDRRLEGTRAASQWLADQMLDLKTKLESSELALYTFRRDNDILSTSLEDRQNIVANRIAALSSSLTELMARRVQLEAALSEVERVRKAHPDDEFWALKLRRVAESPMVADLRKRYVELENQLAAISERYLEKHPERVALEERMQTLRRQLHREIENVLSGMRSEHREVAETERQLEQMIAGLKQEAFELNKKEIDQRRLQREQENNERLYNLVLARLKDADLAVMLRTNNVRLLDAAVPPPSPVKPRVPLVLALSMMLGLFGGVGLVYLVELLDNTIRDEEETEQLLQVPVVGMLPALGFPKGSERGPDRDLVVHLNPNSPYAEACRTVRTNLLFMSAGKPQRIVQFTSPGPIEGKSTSCVNLAIAMAQNGQRVLVIDADLRRPVVHRILGVSNERGLSTLLATDARWEEVVQSTAIEGLSVLPSGPIPPNPVELLHAEKFRKLLEELSRHFDRILVDSPPVFAAADAAVISSLVDGVVFVARYKKTTKEMARRTLRSLEDVNAPILGVLINAVDLKSQEYSYYTYKRYGGYGAGAA